MTISEPHTCDIALAKALLVEVAKLPKECEFNIFKVLEVSEKEVIMCRFLEVILKPDGVHGCGRAFLDLFFDMVLKEVEKPGKDCKVNVRGEKTIEGGRRIDIVIEYCDVSIPIEVKINAGDQKDQCSDYVKHAKNAPLYYLTIEGDEPTNDSDFEAVRDKVVLVSWRTVCEWLAACIREVDKAERSAAFFDTLSQYKKAVESFTEKDDAVVRIIRSSAEYEKAGSIISIAYHALKDEADITEHKAVIDIFQSSPEFTDAAKKISETLMFPQIKTLAMNKVDKRLQKEHGYKIYNASGLTKTYHTDDEKLFLRLQYRSSESLALVVCFIVDKGNFRFAGYRGRWAFYEISGQKDFDMLFDDNYFNDCIKKIVAFAKDLEA